jgi:hypothetical protein
MPGGLPMPVSKAVQVTQTPDAIHNADVKVTEDHLHQQAPESRACDNGFIHSLTIKGLYQQILEKPTMPVYHPDLVFSKCQYELIGKVPQGIDIAIAAHSIDRGNFFQFL